MDAVNNDRNWTDLDQEAALRVATRGLLLGGSQADPIDLDALDTELGELL
jgi:hypothetical protein